MTVSRSWPCSPSSHLYGWPFGISVTVHALAVTMAASVGALTPESAPRAPVPIELVSLDPPAPPPPSPATPKPPRREPKPVRQESKPQPQEKIVAPGLVTQPVEVTRPDPLPAAPLLDDAPRQPSGPATAAEPSGEPTAEKLFSTGDLPIPVGRGGSGGAGGTAQGRDVASTGDVARNTPGDTTGVTALARPLGGYQTRPRYPDSARRAGVEGETLLRFQVLTSGRVGSVSVARTAGHPDLDRAAVEAVTTWLFEPARRGKEAVSVSRCRRTGSGPTVRWMAIAPRVPAPSPRPTRL